MGKLTLPASGSVYVDTQVLIYSVEKIAPYYDVLLTLWSASRHGKITVCTSELSIVEILTGPMKTGNHALIDAYEQLLAGIDLQLIPIESDILRKAAELRASISIPSNH